MITQTYLKEVFNYDGSDLIWKESKGLAVKGKIAGTLNSRGYRHIRLNMQFYQAHRLIWIWNHGFLNDDHLIDHIDGNRLNNSIDNLRTCSSSENSCNRNVSNRNQVGTKNIYTTKSGLYCVECRLYGKQHRTCKFKTVGEAIAVRDVFVASIHKEFATRV